MPNSDLVEAARTHPRLLKIKKPRDERVLQAMMKVDRKNFIPPLSKHLAYEDKEIPIGYLATCSQPSLVAFMCDLLYLKPGLRVFGVGRGCGYHDAIIYELIKGKDDKGNIGELISGEINEDLAWIGEDNLEKQHGQNANIEYLLPADCSRGIPGDSFDRIYFTAAADINTFNTDILLDQLREPGVLMFPESSSESLYVFYKNKGQVAHKKFSGFRFVELQGENK